jgi:hypothetical protein
MKYRLKIEKIDYEHNILHQSQVEIGMETIKEMETSHNIDALEEAFKQLLKQFKQYEQNQSRKM